MAPYHDSLPGVINCISYSYDAGQRLTSLTNPFAETTYYGYQNNNWLTHEDLANGARSSYYYNTKAQITQLENFDGNGNILSNFSGMTYDGVGNRTALAATVNSNTAYSGTTNYAYDAKDELASETSTRNGSYTNTFAYDGAENPTTFRSVSGKTYNSDNQKSNTGFSYDGDGNPTTYNSASLSFDVNDRLTSVGTTLTAGYGADGRRASSMVSSATTYYLYDDDSTSPVCEMNSSGTITATNTYGLAGLISRHTASGSTFYEFDPQGTVVQRLNSAGSNTVTSTADAFGNIANSGTVSDPFGYEAESGYYTDQSTGLLLSTYRYYDPQSGRYLNRDPISYSGGMNVYGYCGNESVVYTDSLGTDPTIRNKLPVGQPGGIEYAPPCYGCAPRDGDGRPINLHHVGQKNDGEVDELPWGAHMGNGNNQLNHTPGQQSEIDRGKFNNWRKKYWKKEADSGRFANLPKWVAPTPSKFNQWISGVSNGQYVEGAFLIPSAIATLGWVALPLAAGAGATATTSGTCALAF